jgi:predicted metal-binding membrane protein
MLAFVHIKRGRYGLRATLVATSAFLFGYLMIWTGFSLLASAVQWGLLQVALMSPAASIPHPAGGGVLLLMAGLYQWTGIKHTCLSQCRTPLGFVLTEWREGVRGAFIMGVRHGRYCLGCCWALMGLLFVVGIMNLLWVGVLAVFVLLEKSVPFGQWLGKAAGMILIIWGLFVLMAGGG